MLGEVPQVFCHYQTLNTYYFYAYILILINYYHYLVFWLLLFNFLHLHLNITALLKGVIRIAHSFTFVALLNEKVTMFWYEPDVKQVEEKKAKVEDPKMLFYGSSSIRLWNTLYEDFQEYRPLNMGFGGATLASCIVYFERLMEGLNPDIILIYAGDNDLGDGRHPEEVFIFFKQMVVDVRKRFGNIPLLFVSIKPSIRRFNIIEQIRFANKIISSEIEHRMDENVFFINIFEAMVDSNRYPNRMLFLPEGLHMNDNGYLIWTQVIKDFMVKNNITLQ